MHVDAGGIAIALLHWSAARQKLMNYRKIKVTQDGLSVKEGNSGWLLQGNLPDLLRTLADLMDTTDFFQSVLNRSSYKTKHLDEYLIQLRYSQSTSG